MTALTLLDYIGRSYDIMPKQFVEISLTFGFGKESLSNYTMEIRLDHVSSLGK